MARAAGKRPVNDNSALWNKRGLTPEGMTLADAAMPFMLVAVRLCAEAPAVAEAVFKEALWQVLVLPTLKYSKARRVFESWKPPGSQE